MLVDAVVEVTLDRATIGIRSQDEPPARGAKLLEFHPQSIELPLQVDLPGPQHDHLPPPDCGSSRSSPCPASSWPASLVDGGEIQPGWAGGYPDPARDRAPPP